MINIDDRYPSYLTQNTLSMHLLLLNPIKEHHTTLPLKRIKSYYSKRMKKRRSESSLPRSFLISRRGSGSWNRMTRMGVYLLG